VELLDAAGRAAAATAVTDGLLEVVAAPASRYRLTAHGRQLADHVLRRII
jgi:hypothetical protein